MASLGSRTTAPQPYLEDADFTLYNGDALEVLRTLPAESVHCVVTSPPYWGLRDYGTGQWSGGDPDCDHTGPPKASDKSGLKNDGRPPEQVGQNDYERSATVPFREVCGKCGAARVDNQLGLEATPDEYIARMVAVFREVRRVLRSDGTCWVNMGSSYFQGESYPLNEKDASWFAGVIDTEGSIQVHCQRRDGVADCYQVDLSVGMITPEVVERCYEITGLGSCKQQASGVFDWSCRGQQAARLLRAIYPYLLGKRKQAALVIMLANDLAARKYGRGNPAQPDVLEWRAKVKQAVSDCNQRRGTELEIAEPTPIALGLKPKDNTLMPARLALALQADGWYVRSDICWFKNNPMPESVTDRPTTSHEFVYLLAKSPRYFFDQEAVREPHTELGIARAKNANSQREHDRIEHPLERNGFDFPTRYLNPAGRNLRSVWEIATQPYPEAHFATYPEELVRRCILAGTSERGCCPECGAPWEREIETTYEKGGGGGPSGKIGNAAGLVQSMPERKTRIDTTLGWSSSCNHDTAPVPCTVLDPFLGSGTTALVARKHGRRTIGIELSREYCELASRRLQQLSLLAESV